VQPLVFFLLGQKGYEVLKAAACGGHEAMVRFVVIGFDDNVQKDFSREIADLCNEHHIEYCARSDVSQISKNAESAIAIAAGWRWLIKDKFDQIIVFHDSLLPKYRGFNPLVTALLNRDPEIGVTAIVANRDFDRGDVIDSKSLTLHYPIKIQDAIDKVSDLYFDLARSILGKIMQNGSLEGVPQDETKASYSVWRDEEDYRIDWKHPAEDIAHFINCLSFPYKGASAVCDDKLIRILDATVAPDVEIANRDVGKVLFVVDNKPVVICGLGLLKIDAAIDDDGRSSLPFKNFRTRLK
jgi:methionyl-tRNA formyltransferase